RRRRIQNLLHHGLAIRPHEPFAVKPNSRRDLERFDNSNRLRKPLAFAAPRHIQYGQTAGAIVGMHFGSCGAISARAHGKAPWKPGSLNRHQRWARLACWLPCGCWAALSTYVMSNRLTARLVTQTVSNFLRRTKSRGNTLARAECLDPAD